MKLNPLDQVKASYIIAIIVLGMGLLPWWFLKWFTQPIEVSEGIFLGDPIFNVEHIVWASGYIIAVAAIWLISYNDRSELKDIVKAIPNKKEVLRYLSLGIGMVISAMGFVYLIYYPLSFIVPSFVESWYLESSRGFFWDESSWYLPGNIASFVAAVIFAPIVEEYLFRGFLLNRFSLYVGVRWAIVISSFLFAILHSDILGAFVFAVFMCLIYIKTRSLIAPMLVHFSNNLFASILEWVDLAWVTGFEEQTLADFQAEWWIGLIALVIGCIWLGLFAKRYLMPVSELIALHEKGVNATVLAATAHQPEA